VQFILIRPRNIPFAYVLFSYIVILDFNMHYANK